MDKKFLDSAGLTYFINKIVYGITSPKFSTGSTYTVGDFVIYTGKLYRCTTAVTVADAWSASKWVQTTVKGEIKALNTNLGGTTFSVTADGAYVHYTPTGGADPVVKKLGNGFELLWTNPTPSSAFAAQTIALDLSKYKYVAIKCVYNNQVSGYLSENIQPVPSQTVQTGYCPFISSMGSTTDGTTRSISISTTGITFGIGVVTTSGSTSANFCIPLKIYGIADIS